MRISDWSSDVCSSDLIHRGLIRTRNPPLGDLAEHLVWKAYGGTLADNSAKSYDVTDADGRRIQVKARAIERSEERRVGKGCSVRVDIGGRRIIKKKNKQKLSKVLQSQNTTYYE